MLQQIHLKANALSGLLPNYCTISVSTFTEPKEWFKHKNDQGREEVIKNIGRLFCTKNLLVRWRNTLLISNVKLIYTLIWIIIVIIQS